jgi:hypothetical protein
LTRRGPRGFAPYQHRPDLGWHSTALLALLAGAARVVNGNAPRNGTGRSKAAVHDLVRARRRAGHSTVTAVLDQLYAGRKQYLIAGSRRCSTKQGGRGHSQRRLDPRHAEGASAEQQARVLRCSRRTAAGRKTCQPSGRGEGRGFQRVHPIEGSSFSGLLTRVEIGHIRIGSAGNGRI